MKTQKYSVNQYVISTVLAFVQSEIISIPEIQRPFVWDSTKVRDLMDSLYQGYPIGYIIAWQNPNIRLKDGTMSNGKKILIDGQQRITALSAAILGKSVINKEYKKVNIQISFHPIEERFEVYNTAIQKDKSWLPDISKILGAQCNIYNVVEDYSKDNPNVEKQIIFEKIQNLQAILNKQVGLIELDNDLDIDVVTEIFIRINSKGVVLSQADFVMSKIASNESYGGNLLRKCIDYFCHLSIAPGFYYHIVEVDKEFCETDYFPKISWLKNENDDLYDPDYTDLIRVAFTSEFNRGRLSDLVNLLSGRNFEERIFQEEIAENSYAILKRGVYNFINETKFKNFVMIIKSAGFIDKSLINSQNALNFSYILYLKLRSKNINPSHIESYVRKWFVLSYITSRYSGSPESKFDSDVKNINNRNFEEFLQDIEDAELSDAFWLSGLPQQLSSSNNNSPSFNTYLAAQSKLNYNGFLSKDITINHLIQHKGDIHHLFPKDYLKKNGFSKSQYNQVANYVYMQTEVNIKIGNRSPIEYFSLLKEQCNNGNPEFGGITDYDFLLKNLSDNDIPIEIIEMTSDNYMEFLEKRRMLLAQKIKLYYKSL